MGLLAKLARIRTSEETERAATERLFDGLTLALAGDARSLGAIYLLGYVPELILMAACAKVHAQENVDFLRSSVNHDYSKLYKQARDADRVTEVDRHRAQANDHDPEFWLFALERKRLAKGRPLDPVILGQAKTHLRTLSTHWCVALRYTDYRPSPEEVTAVFTAVDWLYSRRRILWS